MAVRLFRAHDMGRRCLQCFKFCIFIVLKRLVVHLIFVYLPLTGMNFSNTKLHPIIFNMKLSSLYSDNYKIQNTAIPTSLIFHCSVSWLNSIFIPGYFRLKLTHCRGRIHY
jgi:hypothetical protein